MPQLGQATLAEVDLVGVVLCPLFLAFFSAYSSCRWSARNRLWQDWHSVSGSVKVATWPEASQVCRGRITLESRPTTSSRDCTMERHHWRLMLSLSSTPSGP